MNSEFTTDNSQFLIALGAFLFILGFAHMSPAIALLDARLFRLLHKPLRRLSGFFQVIWHLGRTPFALATLVLLVILDLHFGLTACVGFALIVSFEWFIKRSLKRARPFTLIPDAVMNQPKEPTDPSFPSGDALRIWYLALIIPFSLALPPIFLLLTCSIALLVSLGRIAMGVHFPLDVLAGTGLGLLGVGIAGQFLILN